MVVESNLEVMEKNELDSAKMISCVVRSYSENVTNPLRGYD
jgi:hypothetical protein